MLFGRNANDFWPEAVLIFDGSLIFGTARLYLVLRRTLVGQSDNFENRLPRFSGARLCKDLYTIFLDLLDFQFTASQAAAIFETYISKKR